MRVALGLCRLLVFTAVACAAPATRAPIESPEPTLASRLGLPDSTRILILHADDLGMAPSVNATTISALDQGFVTSASILANGAWLESVREVGSRPSQPDLGVHLTLTSESPLLRFAPAASPELVPTLLDSTGTFRFNLTGVSPLSGAKIETELRAQIARVRALGVRITHLDSHQGTLFGDSTAFAALRRVAKAECLPILLPREYFAQAPYLADAVADGHVPVDHVAMIGPDVPPAEWLSFYERALRDLRPGLTQLIVHLGAADDSSRVLFSAHTEGWDADWRERDAEVVASPTFRQLLRELNVRLVRWADLAPASRLCR